MGVSTKVGAFSTGLGPVGITQDITCGFQPKAIIFWWSGINSGSDTVLFGNSKMSIGFATQTERCCVVTTDDNGVGSCAASHGYRMDACIGSLTVGTSTWDGLIDIDAFANWPSDGFRLIVDDQMPGIGGDFIVGFFAIGGSDITDVDITSYGERTTAGVTDVVNSGFEPSIIFVLSAMSSTAAPFADNDKGGIGFGYAISSSEQGELHGGQDAGSASSDTASYCLDTELTGWMNLNDPTSMIGRTTFTQMNVDGFRTTWISGTLSWQRFALSIKGGLWKGGTLTTTTGTSTDIPINGIGGTPKGVIIASASRVESTTPTATAPLKMSFGAATNTSERHSQAMVSSSGDANMRVVEAIEYDNVYINVTDPGSDGVDGAAGALDGAMDVFSVDADGFTFRMSNGDPSGMFAWWVMVGETPAPAEQPYQPWMQRGPVLAQ